jgi:hypothetical protein
MPEAFLDSAVRGTWGMWRRSQHPHVERSPQPASDEPAGILVLNSDIGHQDRWRL